MRLTVTALNALKATGRQYSASFDNGMTVRVTKKGTLTFAYMYRIGARQRQLTIGQYPNIKLDDANIKLHEAKQMLINGEDPAAVHIEQKQIQKEAPTVKEFAKEFLEKHCIPNKKTWKEDQRVLDKEIIPVIGHLKVKDVTKRMIILLLQPIASRAPQMANRVLNIVSMLFTFAEDQAVIDMSPCVRMKAPAKKKARTRVLNEKEIRVFWEKLIDCPMSIINKLFLKLLLVLAQRRGELVIAEWDQFDLDAGWWEIPDINTKTNNVHRVPLNRMAIEILREIKALNFTDSKYLFPSPSPKKNGAPIDERVPTRACNKAQEFIGLDHFTPHDLRRTAATMMTGAGVPRLTVSKLLNHSEGGVTRIYDKYTYDDEKTQACEIWERKLRAILFNEKSKVVNLRK